MLSFGRNVVGEFDFTTCGELRSVAVVFQESRNWDSIPFMTDDDFECISCVWVRQCPVREVDCETSITIVHVLIFEGKHSTTVHTVAS